MRVRSFFWLFISSLLGQSLMQSSDCSDNIILGTVNALPLTDQPNINDVNIVLIMADDFRRNDIAPYAANPLPLPNLQQLANESVAFMASSVYSVCSPSRQAMLSGIGYPNVLTFDQNFFQLSYESFFAPVYRSKQHLVGMFGKIPHEYDEDLHRQLFYNMNQTSIPRSPLTNGNVDCNGHMIGCKTPKNKLSDHDVSKSAINFIKKAKILKDQKQIRNIFLAVGLHRPHIQMASFRANNFAANRISANTTAPQIDTNGNPPLAHRVCVELKKMRLNSKKISKPDALISSDKALKQLTNLYFDALYATDYFIGTIIDALKTAGFYDNAVIIFTSDHGFALGEFGDLCKSSLREQATGIPLFIKVPGIKGGFTANSLASNIDIFPTILDSVFGVGAAAKYRHPSGANLQGKSLLPAITNNTVVNKNTFSRYGRCQPITQAQTSECGTDEKVGSCDRPLITHMGHQIEFLYNDSHCIYNGWWPHYEIRLDLGCRKPTWPNMPPVLFGYGVASPQIDLKKSYTDFDEDPIQEELYCFNTKNKYGAGDHPNLNNMALKPVNKDVAALITQSRKAITANYPKP